MNADRKLLELLLDIENGYEYQLKIREAILEYVDKEKKKYHMEKLKQGVLDEDDHDSNKKELNTIKATMLANFGRDAQRHDFRLPLDTFDSATSMFIKIIKHYESIIKPKQV